MQNQAKGSPKTAAPDLTSLRPAFHTHP